MLDRKRSPALSSPGKTAACPPRRAAGRLREDTMSKRNGDKARYHLKRKARIARRTRLRQLREDSKGKPAKA
jgi:hypothetical protein